MSTSSEMIIKRGFAFTDSSVITPSIGVTARPCKPPLSVKRGKITTFSKDSCSRLRSFLALHDVPNCDKYAFTLTISTRNTIDDAIYRKMWQYFMVYAMRDQLLFHCGIVYRHEHQCSGQPHTHLILYAPSNSSPVSIYCSLSYIWLKIQCRFVPGFEFTPFQFYSIVMERITDEGKSFKYLLDHLSKHKKSQLGFQGRQWGIFNRPKFKEVEFSTMSHNRHSVKLQAKIKRTIQNLLRFRKNGRIIKPKRITKFVFLPKQTIRKLKEYIKIMSLEEGQNERRSKLAETRVSERDAATSMVARLGRKSDTMYRA